MTISIGSLIRSMFQQDSGAVTGTALNRSPKISRYNVLTANGPTRAFGFSFNATAQDTGKWQNANNLFTSTLSGGYVNLNASGITTTAAAQVWSTYQTFPLFGGTPVTFDISGTAAALTAANQVFEAGQGLTNSVTPYAVTDGAYFQVTSGGIYGVLNYSGVLTTPLLLVPAAAVQLNVNGVYRGIITQDIVEFWAGDSNGIFTLLGSIPVPSGNGQPFSSSSAPIFVRLQNTGAAGGVFQPKFSNVNVYYSDTALNLTLGEQANSMGAHPYQGQDGGTMGTTAKYTNSLAAGAGAVMTNTTAALGTGFGGSFDFLPTLAVGTDGILDSYQNPIGGVNQTPHVILVYGVKIQSVVSTVLVGNATPVIMEYAVCFGHTAVSLATAESATTKAPRRIPIGFEVFGAAAALGTLGSVNGVYMQFTNPIPINPGEFIAISAKNIGAVTSTGVITASVCFDATQL